MRPSPSNYFRNVAKICWGLFLTDPKRSFLGRVWQLVSRFTWELPQTLVGWLYTLGRALVGQVDRVDRFGGITFATKVKGQGCMGVSLGTFVNLWDGHWSPTSGLAGSGASQEGQGPPEGHSRPSPTALPHPS